MLLCAVAASALAHSTVAVKATATYRCVGPQIVLFNNSNGGAVQNGGSEPGFSTNTPVCLISISTYHWNNGNGAAPGTIGLTATNGTQLGPWAATGSGGSGAPNVNWTVTPGSASQPVILRGGYSCNDSSPSTWSENAASYGQGFCKVTVERAQQGSASTFEKTVFLRLPAFGHGFFDEVILSAKLARGERVSESDFTVRIGNLSSLPANFRAAAALTKPKISHGRWIEVVWFALNYPKTLSARDTEAVASAEGDAAQIIFDVAAYTGGSINEAGGHLYKCLNSKIAAEVFDHAHTISLGVSLGRAIAQHTAKACP